MDEPYPCRFCGRPPKLGNTYIGERQYFKMSCLACHADSFPCLSVQEATKDWNERHGKRSLVRDIRDAR